MKLALNRFQQPFVIVFILALGGTLVPNGSPQSQPDIALKKLWSPDESERAEAINELLRIGPASIEKLTSLLAELLQDQRPRFSPGSEQDGERALQEYLRSARRLFAEGGDSAEMRAAQDRVMALTVNSRLMTDVIHLLGELKAEQSVPLLMEMVNRHWEITYLGLQFRTPATAALERIGAACVPQLLENLKESTIRAHGFEPLANGWQVVVDEDDAEDENEPDPDEELDRQTHISNVRIRVAAILGKIGDTQALPYLEKFLAEINSIPESAAFGTAGSLSRTIESTIAMIKKTGPWSPEKNAGSIRVEQKSGNDFGRTPSSRKPE